MTKENAKQLAFAIQNADLQTIQEFIDKKEDLEQKIGHGLPPLALACYFLNIDIVRMLLAAGVNVNTPYDKNKTALTQVCESYQQPEEKVLPIVQLLLEHGAEVNLVKKGDDGALQYAAMYGYPEVVNLLLQAGAEVNKKGGYGRTAWIYAATASHGDSLKSLKYLLAAGADVHAANDAKENALWEHITRHDNEAVADFLIQSGIDFNTNNKMGETVLHWAAFCGRVNIVKLLLEKGMDINLKNKNGQTPLQKAMSFQKTPVVKFLFERGANIGNQWFVFSIVKYAVEQKEDEFALKIIKDRQMKTSAGGLTAAAERGNLALAKAFLELGISVDDRLHEGDKTPLIAAAYYGKTEMVKFLLEQGADVNLYDYKKDTALLHAAWSSQTKIIEMLLDAGADINQRNRYNWNALMQTCERNDYENCKLLLERGSPTDEIDQEYGATALTIAQESKATKIVELLLAYNAKERFIKKRKKDEPLYAILDCDICAYLDDKKDLRKTIEITNFPHLKTLSEKNHEEANYLKTNERILECTNCATTYYNLHKQEVQDDLYSSVSITNSWERINLIRLKTVLQELGLLAELERLKKHYPIIIEQFKTAILTPNTIKPYHFNYVVETLLDYFVQEGKREGLDKYLLGNANEKVVVMAREMLKKKYNMGGGV